jgi:hypothetical protein
LSREALYENFTPIEILKDKYKAFANVNIIHEELTTLLLERKLI